MDDRDSNPGRGKIFLFRRKSRSAVRSTQPPAPYAPVRGGGLFCKGENLEAVHSPATSVEVKNGGAVPPLLHPINLCLINYTDNSTPMETYRGSHVQLQVWHQTTETT
jgi:hypothetical protein